MEIIMLFEKKLYGTHDERIVQMLEMAGWHKGRYVDVSLVEKYYKEQRVAVVHPAKDFFHEYYGIADAWYITRSPKLTSIGRVAPDFQFDLYPSKRLDEVSEFVFDVYGNGYPNPHKEQIAINDAAREETTLVGEIGYYYPARVWIGASGAFYTLHEYDHGEVHFYRTLIDFLMWETKQLSLDSAVILQLNK